MAGAVLEGEGVARVQRVADLVTVCIGRRLATHRKVQIGVNAPLAEAAALLARRIGRPGPDVYVMGMTGVYFTPPRVTLFRSESDAIADGASFPLEVLLDLVGGWDGVDDEPVHPLQIDARGAVTLCGLAGEDGEVRLLGPGPAGLDLLPHLLRGAPTVYLTEHSPRTLVERGAWIGAAVDGERGERAPVTVITDLAVLELSPARRRAVSVHAGVDPAAVASATGFALELDGAPETPPPTAAELEALAAVDPANLRTLEFLPREERHRAALAVWEAESGGGR